MELVALLENLEFRNNMLDVFGYPRLLARLFEFANGFLRSDSTYRPQSNALDSDSVDSQTKANTLASPRRYFATARLFHFTGLMFNKLEQASVASQLRQLEGIPENIDGRHYGVVRISRHRPTTQWTWSKYRLFKQRARESRQSAYLLPTLRP